MGQVPETNIPASREPFSYVLVGSGRLARHLGHYFSSLEIPFQQWSRRTHTRVQLETLAKQNRSILLLAVSDRALPELIQELPGKKVHFSGSLSFDEASGWHPLMTFSEQLYTLEFYRQIPFIGEKGREGFQEIFPQLNNPHFQIAREEKPLYHALCVLSGNFTALLWKKYFSDMQEKFGLSPETLAPYFHAIYRNIEGDPERALTGPLVRGDQAVIEKNLAALEGDEFQSTYRGFVETYQLLREKV